MSSIKIFVENKLQEIIKKNNYRYTQIIENLEENYILLDGKKIISFASNDYLGLKSNKQIINNSRDLVENHANSGSSSRFVSGNYGLYNILENNIARFKNYEAACVFGSGYLANIGVIPALMSNKDLIIADKLIHASLIDGIKLSNSKFLRYRHNDIDRLRELLYSYRNKYEKCLIVTESIFSMDGDRADINQINKLAKEYDCWLLVDDAHGVGEDLEKIDILIGTFSKSFASYGGYVCADASVVDYIKNKSRSLIFTTSLPPYVIASSISSLDYIIKNPDICKLPLEKAKLFCNILGNIKANSHIVPIILGDSTKTLNAVEGLKKMGYYVAGIRYPSVGENSSRIRLSFSATHSNSEIEKLANIIKSQELI